MLTTLRQTFVPIDHAIAEVIAFPLASEAAFRRGVTTLTPAPHGDSCQLWLDFAAEAGRGLLGFTPDELAILRDRCWYGTTDSTIIPLHAYLRRHARGLLKANGRVAVPRALADGADEEYLPSDAEEEEGEAAARRRWRWTTFALPPDLLLAALHQIAPPVQVDALSPILRRRLADAGYADSHLHVGAGLTFAQLWASLQLALADEQCKASQFASNGAAFDDGRSFAPWLLRAAFARCLVAAYLAHGRSRYPTLAAFYTAEVYRRLRDDYGSVPASILTLGLKELCSGTFAEDSPAWEDLHQLYCELYPKFGRNAPTLDELGHIDPVASFVGWQPGNSELPDAMWTRNALAGLEAGPPDPRLTSLVWQCIRLRCLFFPPCLATTTDGWDSLVHPVLWPSVASKGMVQTAQGAADRIGDAAPRGW
jgi:hypothetical protein